MLGTIRLLFAVAWVGCLCGSALAQERKEQVQAEPRLHRLPDEVQLARLIDLCATELGLDIQYDPKALQGITVTVRLQRGLTDEELWTLANELLATNGLTTVRAPGAGLITVTKLAEAQQQARLEKDHQTAQAGFVNVLAEVQHRDAKKLAESLKVLLSKPGGAISQVADTQLLLISDTRPRVDQILSLLERLDVTTDAPVVEAIAVDNLPAKQLQGIVSAAAIAIGAMQQMELKGKLFPSPDDDALVVIAPAEELAQWRSLVEQFDQRQAAERRTYTPRYFPAEQVASLIEQIARDEGPRGSGEQWQAVVDKLTGTLIVTATPAEHQQIQELIDRLESVPQAAQRPVRTFPIRNRGVQEIVQILQGLIDAGVLERSTGEEPAPEESLARQDSRREVLPSGAELVTPPNNLQPEGSKQNARGLAQGTGAATAKLRPGPGQPDLTLTADEGTNTLIAIGDLQRLKQLEELIETLDVRQPQVMIEALVLGLSDSQTLDLGVELEKLEISGSTLIRLSSLFGLGMPGLSAAAPSTGPGGTALVLNPGDFRILLRALETINKGRTLNIPKVLVNNNQQAVLDSVLEQPFTSTNASTTVATTSFGGTQDAGTQVTAKPQIAEGDHLVLEFNVSLSAFVGDSADPNLPPPRQTNSLQSVATIPDGYTVAVGGLEAITETRAVNQVPLLGWIPVIGEAFKNRSVTKSRARFFVFIRVNILRHGGFEDLKYISERDALVADIDDGWPVVKPRIVR